MSDAIHPGYGFLSENADFAEVCETSEIKFIGPKPRRHARHGAETARPRGDEGVRRSDSAGFGRNSSRTRRTRSKPPRQIGYPVMLKASAGGGGRGMRWFTKPPNCRPCSRRRNRKREPRSRRRTSIWKSWSVAPRHIEFQVLADEHGNVEILGERDCSIQRRHQKLVEEAPVAGHDAQTARQDEARLATALQADRIYQRGHRRVSDGRSGNLYFIEVNARIQVEHPVTESITGIDLVKAQILIAAGHHLPEIIRQPYHLRGHAIECRINAENPETFAPSPGRITGLNLPGDIGIRVDTAAYTDYVIPPYYDSLVAKLIAYGHDRAEAIARMRRALDMFVVEGIYTTIPLHQKIMNDPDFIAGKMDTCFLSRFGTRL